MEEQTNPYAGPNAPVVVKNDKNTDDDKFGVINLFGSRGRMGRMRYFYYSILVGIAGLLVMVLLLIFLLWVVKMDRDPSVNIILFFYIIWMLWFTSSLSSVAMILI